MIVTDERNGQERSGPTSLLARIFGGQTNVPVDIQELLMEDPGRLPFPYIVGIAQQSAALYDTALAEDRAEVASEHLRVARRLSGFIYDKFEQGQRRIFPAVFFDEGATNTGALGLGIDPDREYPQGYPGHFLLKDITDLGGRQAVRDSRYFQDDANLTVENIVAYVPRESGENGFLWKQFVVGPDVSTALTVLDKSLRDAKADDKGLYSQLEAELKGATTRQLIHWQQNAPQLIGISSSPEALVDRYQRNLCDIVDTFSQFTDVDFTQAERDSFRTAVESLDWSFIDDTRVVRGSHTTYKNRVLYTGKINLDGSQLVSRFAKENGKRSIKRERVEDALHFVDTPNQLAHPLEDPWENDLSVEGSVRRSAVDRVMGDYKKRGIEFSKEEKWMIGIYRAFRSAYLTLARGGLKAHDRFQRELLTTVEYAGVEQQHNADIRRMLMKGNIHLGKLRPMVTPDQRDNFEVFASTLNRLIDYNVISYTR